MGWWRLADRPGQRIQDPSFPDIVYWEIREGAVWHQGRKLRGANAAAFEVRADDHVFVARDDQRVFHAWSRLNDVDRETFEVLGDGYFRDVRLAYYEFETSLKPLKGRDRERFVVLGNGFARDAVHGYFCGKPIRGCTAPLTLGVVEAAGALPYAIDDEHVYFEGAVLKRAKPEEWVLLGGAFSRAGRHGFFGARKLPRVDVESWVPIVDDGGTFTSYSRDARSVFVMFLRLPDANPATWTRIAGSYSTDGVRVYFVDRVLEGVDVASFEVTSPTGEYPQTGRDKLGPFRGAERVR